MNKIAAALAADQKARTIALDAEHSFIIQAPAGSGKTGLLVQRYLTLLAKTAHSPKEILAITFTKKAAEEMSDRVLSALELAKTAYQGVSTFEQTTHALAKQALAHCDNKGWEVNADTLRIMTIDALAQLIINAIPIAAQRIQLSGLIENPQADYEHVATRTLEKYSQNPAVKPDIEFLLLSLDNQAERLKSLLVNMLNKRAEWLPAIIPHFRTPEHLLDILMSSFQNIAREEISLLEKQLSADEQLSLHELLVFSHAQRDIPLPKKPLDSLEGQLTYYQAAAALLLTKQLAWRKSISARQGFPASGTEKDPAEKAHLKEKKAQLLALISRFSQQAGRQEQWLRIVQLPPLSFTEKQSASLKTLLNLLPLLAAELKMYYEKQGKCDFTEISLSAIQALHTPDGPTDIALLLDTQIHHILMDEFQDTSLTQYYLLEQLLFNYAGNTKKSLFLVGDPMQSIYRFRQAEVGIFLRTKQEGIAGIPLAFLELRQNFRSSPELIHWFNATFPSIFPTTEDINLGKMTYLSAIPGTYTESNTQECISILTSTEALITHIKALQAKSSEETIAILLRSKRHSEGIIKALLVAQIPYSGKDLVRLIQAPIIKDLLSLITALLHWGDRLSWLSILRSPLCSLSLPDLYHIANLNGLIWENILNIAAETDLSDDGKLRLKKFKDIISTAYHYKDEQNFSSWIQCIWYKLTDTIALSTEEVAALTAGFEILQEHTLHANQVEIKVISARFSDAFLPSQDTGKVQLLSIHKAKGLEFDHIIIPEVSAAPPPEKNTLLALSTYTTMHEEGILLAPLQHTTEENPHYQYIKRLEKERLLYEYQRLFYVACTRAKVSIAFCCKEKDPKTIKSSSFLTFIQHLFVA